MWKGNDVRVPGGFDAPVKGNGFTMVRKSSDSLLDLVSSEGDVFECTFDAGYTPEQKAVILSSIALVDFMFFEHPQDVMSCGSNESEGCYVDINLFNCYCYGTHG